MTWRNCAATKSSDLARIDYVHVYGYIDGGARI